MQNKALETLTREELMELIELYSKNWLAHDGLWFQSIERGRGMEEAVQHDRSACEAFTRIEAKRIREFLHLPERAGLDGLQKALNFRFYANINESEFIREGENVLVYRMVQCRVQNARKRKGMPFHPCKSVGIPEYSFFAKEIDDRIRCECVSCYPDITDPTCACSWRFILEDAD